MKKILITNNSHLFLSKAGGYGKQIYYLTKIFKELGYQIYYLLYAYKINNGESYLKIYTYHDLVQLYEASIYNDVKLLEDDVVKDTLYLSIQSEERYIEENTIHEIIDHHNIDLFFFLGDAFLFRKYKENAFKVPSYYWYPCHFYPICNYDYQGLNAFSNILSLSPSIKMVLEEMFPNKNIYYLPHIVEKIKVEKTKEEIRKQWNIPKNKYVVLLVFNIFDEFQDVYHVNRKSIDTQIIAFKKFNEKYSNSLLFIHSLKGKYATPNQCYPLEELLTALNLSNDTYLWNKELLDEEQLREVYAMSDTFMNCTKAEGFGVPILEAQMYDLNVITNDFTSMKEHNFQGNIAEASSSEIHYGVYSNWITPSSENIFKMLENVFLCDTDNEKNKNIKKINTNKIKQNRSKWIINELTDYNNIKNKLYKIIENK